MLKRWIPWKFILKRTARAYGFIDPLTFLARIRQFSQPSEVQEPIELVRAGIAFHTRGLINTKAIQHNLDWVWPYWVERQFNPEDNSFIPRAFSFSHVNLTHRNWTAVGHPTLPIYPIVDPRGLVTPLYDGWSIDFWLVTEEGERLLPSRLEEVDQRWLLTPNLAVRTRCRQGKLELDCLARVELLADKPTLMIEARAEAPADGFLVVALRPYNPEGIQFIETISPLEDGCGWLVNDEIPIGFDRRPDRLLYANYEESDVLHKLEAPGARKGIDCAVGMATSAALFPLDRNGGTTLRTTVSLNREMDEWQRNGRSGPVARPAGEAWRRARRQAAALEVADERIQFLYDAALSTVLLLSADDIVPGPYTYRRFWFRDACLMLNGLLTLGLKERVRRIMDTFPERQKMSGYFQSQEGEWDSNGQVLWLMDRYQQVTGEQLPDSWLEAAAKGADWIIRKRTREKVLSPHTGLLPAGFSAEHLGPNDYYYWDDFWGLAGLQSAARLAGLSRDRRQHYQQEARDFEKCIFASIAKIAPHRSRGGIPASPYRRMDAGAIGSMVADYPLQLTPAGDERVGKTAEFLIANCFHRGAFFQDMIHSGTNIYLTLDIAQTLLRNGDSRYRDLIDTVADLASPTGQWPEAIHPLTQGGCMGDGQHGWAAAEWLMMIARLFVREEEDRLVIGSGIFPRWLEAETPLSFGPAGTRFGEVKVVISPSTQESVVELETEYHAESEPAAIVVEVPGYRQSVDRTGQQKRFILEEL